MSRCAVVTESMVAAQVAAVRPATATAMHERDRMPDAAPRDFDQTASVCWSTPSTGATATPGRSEAAETHGALTRREQRPPTAQIHEGPSDSRGSRLRCRCYTAERCGGFERSICSAVAAGCPKD